MVQADDFYYSGGGSLAIYWFKSWLATWFLLYNYIYVGLGLSTSLLIY